MGLLVFREERGGKIAHPGLGLAAQQCVFLDQGVGFGGFRLGVALQGRSGLRVLVEMVGLPVPVDLDDPVMLPVDFVPEDAHERAASLPSALIVRMAS